MSIWVQGRTHKNVATETPEEDVERDYVTNAFTALHFLDFDEAAGSGSRRAVRRRSAWSD